MVLCNKEHARGRGVTPEEYVKLPERYPNHRPEDFARLDKMWKEVFELGTKFDYEVNKTNFDGTKVYMHVVVVPLVDHEGNVTGGLSMQENITEKKEIEEKLRQAQKNGGSGRTGGRGSARFQQHASNYPRLRKPSLNA